MRERREPAARAVGSAPERARASASSSARGAAASSASCSPNRCCCRCVGGAAGIALAYALTQGLIALDPLKIPRVQDIALDGRVLAFTAAISLVTGVLFGIVPALQSSRTDLQSVLKEGGRDSHVATGWLRRALVVGEVARVGRARRGGDAARAQLRAAARRRRRLQPGARADAADVAAERDLHRRGRDGAGLRRGRAAGCASRPACRRAGAVTGLPLASTRGDWGIRIEGRPADDHRENLAADWQVVTPGYFEALGTPLRAGRTFTDADRADTLPVIVVNETMAKKFWPGVSAVGRRMRMGGNDRGSRWSASSPTSTIAGSTCCRGRRCIARTRSSATAARTRRRCRP